MRTGVAESRALKDTLGLVKSLPAAGRTLPVCCGARPFATSNATIFESAPLGVEIETGRAE